VQVVASVGYTFVEPAENHTHLSLDWRSGRFESQPASEHGFYAALDPRRLQLTIHGRDGDPVGSFSLPGRTLDEAYHWLQLESAKLANGHKTKRIRPDHELPDHAVGSGGSFSLNRAEEFGLLSDWYENAAGLLASAREDWKGASPVRCWPHHMDIATLILIDKGLEPEEGRTIGVGLSPGDSSYGEPYWYVSPWPPPTSDLPSLHSAGFWHTEGWTGAVLRGTEITHSPDQYKMVSFFLNEAVETCHEILDSPR
jgi:hypothetical protein